jgi:8-oxo-dGTP pyrophosphatase MutT (NUDIX family)
VSGTPTDGDEEVHELRWFDPGEIAARDLDHLNRHLLADAGVIDAPN